MPTDYFLQHCDAHSRFSLPFVFDYSIVHSFEKVNNKRFELVVSVRNLKTRSTSPPALKEKISSALLEHVCHLKYFRQGKPGVPSACLPFSCGFNPLDAELSPICHFLALLGTHHILHVSRIRVKMAASHIIYCRKASNSADYTASFPSTSTCDMCVCVCVIRPGYCRKHMSCCPRSRRTACTVQ